MKNVFFWLLATIITINSWGQTQLNEGFEGTVFPPDYWTTTNVSGNSYWERYTLNSPMGIACASIGFANFSHENWLITPKLSIENEDDSISFYIKAGNLSSGTTLNVRISTTNKEITSFNATPLLTFISGTSSTTSDFTTSWVRYAIELSPYIGEEIYIAFQVVDNNGIRVMLDDVQGPNIVLPLCPKPTNLTISDVTTTSVNLSWIDPFANAFSWDIQYMPSTETSWNNAETITTSSNPYTLNYLQSNTKYKLRIKAECNEEESDWTSYEEFQTACASITTLPYFNNFDSEQAGSMINPIIPSCWVRTSNSIVYPYITNSNANSGSNSLLFYVSSLSSNATIITPPFAENINSLRVKFWAKSNNENNNILVGVMSDLGDLSTIEMVDTITLSTTYTEYETLFNETQLTGGNRYIVLKASSGEGNTYAYIYVDDLTVDSISSCLRPTNLDISNITSNSADLSWMDENASLWNIQYMLETETSWDNATIETATYSPYTIEELLGNTLYKVRIQTICSDDESEWTSPINFKTACASENIPYSQNFDASTSLPPCHSLIKGNSDIDYEEYYSEPQSIKFSNQAWISTPAFTEDISLLKVQFMAKAEDASSGDLEIGIMSNPDDTTTFESVSIIQPNAIGNWVEYEVPFNETTLNGENLYIAFKQNTTSNYYYWWIDDILVDFIPSCARPTELSANNITQTSFDLSFVSEAYSWNVEYMLETENDWENATRILITSFPYTIEELTQNTLYKIRVKANCTGAESNWTSPITVKTLCNSIETLPYIMNFDNEIVDYSSAPTCWMKPSYYDTYPYVYNYSANSGSNSLYFSLSLESDEVSIITPPFSENINSLRIKLWAKSNSANNKIGIGVMSDAGDLSTIEMVDTIILSTTYTEYEIWFNETQEIDQNVYIILTALLGQENTYASVYIDDVIIDYIPSCIRPTNFSASNITNNSVDLSWNDQEAYSWNIEYMPTTETSWENATGIVTTENPYTLNSISSGTEYKVRLQANCDNGQSDWTNQIIFTTLQIVPPTITTLEVTEITETSATFNGEATKGTEEIYEKGFELKTSNQTWEEASQLSVQGTSPFTLTYTSLTENQTYDVRAYVATGENGETITYGEVKSFTTLESQEPIITIGEVTANANVLQNSVELLGEVVSFGGEDATEVSVGFIYGLENTLTNDVEEVSSTLNGTTFLTILTDLTPATTYYYVSFITNSAGTALSEIGEFTTNNSLSNNIKSGNVNIVMYPNPAEKETKLVISGKNGKIKMSLTDTQGRIIFAQTILVNNKTEQVLDLSNLTKGVYYLQLKGENINSTQRLIVK
ncbi:MAG: fibronectin type III domain-containing protein [Bacteroidales bacterium]|jgi:hypothetical protein|nr:fibronectin type III domain-containing protein [Bacteroidales bacterium]